MADGLNACTINVANLPPLTYCILEKFGDCKRLVTISVELQFDFYKILHNVKILAEK